jgi:hypothetical protein
MFYYSKGYMADWILHTARQNNVDNVDIDIINEKVIPTCLEIKPIVALLPSLRQTIDTTLVSNDFPTDFIVKANFLIDIPKDSKNNYIKVKCIAVDKNNHIYEGHVYSEKAYELHKTFFDTLKKLFTRT